jgi:hypothetical protein
VCILMSFCLFTDYGVSSWTLQPKIERMRMNMKALSRVSLVSVFPRRESVVFSPKLLAFAKVFKNR